jgi:glutathione synthase
MKFLVIMDPIEAVQVDKDTTFGFMLAAQARGHELWYCQQRNLHLKGNVGCAKAWPVTVQAVQGEHFTLGAAVDGPMAGFDSVWMRKDPPVDRAFLHATYVLDFAGTQVLNRPSGLRDANEKIYALNFPTVIPETRVTRDAEQIKAWLAERAGLENGALIVKPIDGHGGRGIFRIEQGDRNINAILEALTGEGEQWVMAQAYLPQAREGDKRILLVDGEPLGAILRVPQADDNRGNMHVGGSVKPSPLTPRDLEICDAVGSKLREDGLMFVGLDVIGGHLTEVNVTSPTGIMEVLALGGIDVGDAYVAWIEAHPDWR